MADREELSWELFGAATRQLAVDVVTDGYAPDLILAIARRSLRRGLVRLRVMQPPMPSIADLGGARVLIADDVADTGATLRFVRDFCEYVWRRTDRWIDLPWTNPESAPA